MDAIKQTYTFFFEYRGGVTIRQVMADDLAEATQNVVKVMPQDRGISWRDFLDSKPVPVEAMKNVWCITALIDNDENLCMCHITITA
ncbi:MAG: hypothetical protein ACK5G9_11015 [Akkermansiaceae bacterium]|jgi:hypothetical protein